MSMFFQSERLDFQTTIECTCTELGDSWADKIRSRIAFAQNFVATGSNLEQTNKYHKVANKGVVGAEVNFIRSDTSKNTEKGFLSNTKNKQRFIDMLSAAGLRDNGCKPMHA